MCTLIPILGLDPAGPFFGSDILNLISIEMPLPFRLDPSDAQYVQCIRTSMLGFNIINFSCGHGNFIMFGGNTQPHCSIDLACNHAAARLYFKSSLNPKNKIIGSARVTDKIAGGICRCKTGQPIIAAKLPQLIAFRAERLGIYNERLNGTFYVDNEPRHRGVIME